MTKVMRLFSLMFVALLVTSSGLYAGGGEEFPEATPQEMEQYYKDLRGQIIISQQHVSALMQEFGANRSTISIQMPLEIQLALSTLDAKKILYANFVGKDSLKRSPIIRKQLMDIFKLKNVTENDLASLQAVVSVEKQKMGLM